MHGAQLEYSLRWRTPAKELDVKERRSDGDDRVKADLHIQVLGGEKEKEVEEDTYHKQ